MSERCGDCKFYLGITKKLSEREQCRRHAPRIHIRTDTHNSELLRDIAWSLRELANIETPKSEYDPMNENAQGWDDERWPYVDEDEWCGEFQSK